MKTVTLYRHYDTHGELLYIGISCTFHKRTYDHLRLSQWWLQVATIKLEHFSSEQYAKVAERIAIASENPIYNREGSSNKRKIVTRSYHDGIRPRRILVAPAADDDI